MKDQKYSRSLLRKKVMILGAGSLVGMATAMLAADEGAHVTAICSELLDECSNFPILPFGSTMRVTKLNQENDFEKLFADKTPVDHLILIMPEYIATGNEILPDQIRHGRFITQCFATITVAFKYALPLMTAGSSITISAGDDGFDLQDQCTPVRCLLEILPIYTKTMAPYLAPVRLNCVVGGLTGNKFYSHPVAERAAAVEHIKENLFVGRLGEPADFALAFLYLMKQHLSTGQSLAVNGGMPVRY